MTTELSLRWRSCAKALGVALAAWFAGVVAVTFLFEPTSSVVVVGPRSAAEAVSAAEQGAIIDVRPGYTRVASLQKGVVRSLYAHGAWLVWPMIDGGCAGLLS